MLPCMREWYETHVLEPKSPESRERERGRPKIRTAALADEVAAIAAISPSRVTYVPGIATKRFAREIQGTKELTDAQRLYLWQVVWKFRRQIADKRLVELARQRCGSVHSAAT